MVRKSNYVARVVSESILSETQSYIKNSFEKIEILFNEEAQVVLDYNIELNRNLIYRIEQVNTLL